MKRWYQSKTIQVFGAVGIIAAALLGENLLGLDFNTGVELREAAAAIVASAVALALRFVTNQGVEL